MKRLHSSLWITPFYAPFISGAAAFVQAMAQRSAADGDRVTVLTTDAREARDFWQPPTPAITPLPEREVVGGVTVERLSLAYPWPAPYTFGVLRRFGHGLHRLNLSAAIQAPLLSQLACWMPPLPSLAAALRRLVPAADIVQAVDGSWDGLFTAAFAAAQRHAKPLLAVPLMHLGDAGVRAHFQMAHLVEAYRRSQAVLALSQREATAYRALGISPANIHIIRMGIETLSPEVEIRKESARFRQQHGLSGPIVAFVGANTYDKGAFTLALAVAQLNSEGLPVNLIFAGSGSEGLTAFLTKQPPELRQAVEERIHILGVVDEKTKHNLLAACDLLALPSQVDTFGIVLLEAWLHDKPVIGADAGGIPDLVRDREDGLLVPFGDVMALATAIRRLLAEPGLAARLGAAGGERVRREFTWERTYDTLRRIYVEMIRETI